MSATTTRKPKAAKHDPNAASTDLLARIHSICTARNGEEIDLLADFARAVESGTMTADGVKATLKAAEAVGDRLSYFRPTHAEYVVTMHSLSLLPDAPRDFDALYTLADRLTRIQVKTKGVTKAAKARAMAADVAAKGTDYAKVADAVNKKHKKAQKDKAGTARPDAGNKGDKKAPTATTSPDVAALAAWVAGLSDDDLTADLQASLYALADAIHDRLDTLAE